MSQKFGGDWTVTKLNILSKYLDAYTTVFKDQHWARILYVDAFAGTGEINCRTQKDIKELIDGSAKCALQVDNREFDQFVFIERDEERCQKLNNLKSSNADRKIAVRREDANLYLQTTLPKIDKKIWRGVLFLDPFATEVEWRTMKTIASCGFLDTWLLFPTMAVARMLPTSSDDPNNLDCAQQLNKVFGDDSWKDLYGTNPQQDFLNQSPQLRERGVQGILSLYKKKLKGLFVNRLLDKSKELKNSREAPLFEFIFMTGSDTPAAIKRSHDIAKHLIDIDGI